ncbi:MAG: hypothetical protein K8953_08700, partial [Proteobacteria bacterium]|nr:hypothetical protein [Pseudomonadota bacterium]
EGTDVGSNPFNADYCFAGGDNTIFATQRKAVVDGCDGVTDATETCTQEIIDCIANPFATSGITTGANTVACDDASITAAFVNPTITYCGTGASSGGSGDTANISLEKCQMFATTNTCVANPFGSTCTNAMLGGDDDNDELTAARLLRTTYCSGLGTTSAAIRADTSGSTPSNPICLGAVEAFCTGDAQFSTGGNANEFNCLTDATYNSTRAMHYTACIADETTRTGAGTVCTNAMSEICTVTDGAQTNPWASICGASNTAAQITVLNACLAKDPGVESGQRSEPGNVCIRALADAEANTDVVEILATCIAEPRNMACDDYAADAGEPFNSERVELYVSSCAGDEALTNGAQAAFCPEEAVKAELCLGTNGANARPFAPICTQTTVTPNLASAQGLILQICVETANDNDDRCMHSQANAAVIAVRASCNATTGDPFATARP